MLAKTVLAEPPPRRYLARPAPSPSPCCVLFPHHAQVVARDVQKEHTAGLAGDV